MTSSPLRSLHVATLDLDPDDLGGHVRHLARRLDDVVDLLVLDTGDGADAAVVAQFLALQTTRLLLAPGIPAAAADPFHVAKRLQTLDHATRGRAVWWLELGAPTPPARTAELLHVVRSLWRSWDPDALVVDATAGRYLHPDRVRHIDHVGEFFRVRGPSLTPAGPQWCPPVLATDADPAPADVRLGDLDLLDARGRLAEVLAGLPPREAAPAGTARERFGLPTLEVVRA